MSTASRKVSTSSMVTSLAKRFDPNALQNNGPTAAQEAAQGAAQGATQAHLVCKDPRTPMTLNSMDTKFDILSQKIDSLLVVQNNVVKKLEYISQDVGGIEKDLEMIKSDTTKTEKSYQIQEDKENTLEMKGLFLEMTNNLSSINKYAEQQAKRLDGVEQILLGTQTLISFLVEGIKMSAIFEFVQKRQNPSKPPGGDNKVKSQKDKGNEKGKNGSRVRDYTKRRKILVNKKNDKVTTDHKTKQEKEKPYLDFNGTTSPKKKPPDSERSVQTIQFCAHKEKVQKLNQENTEKTTVIVVEGGAPEVQLEANCDIERCISIDIPISHSKTSVQGGTPIIFPTEAVVDRETAAQNEETIQSPTEESAEAEDAEECLHKIQEYKEDTKCVTVEGEDEQKIVCVVNSENEKGVEQDANKQEVKGDEEQIVESETAKEETKSILVIEEEELVISEDQDQTVGYTETSQDISKCPEIEGQLHVTCTDPSQSEKDTQALPEEVKEIPADLSQNGEICHHEQSWGSKRRGTDEDHVKDDSKKSRVDTQATEENVTAGDAEETSLAIPIEEPQTSDSTEDGDEQPPLIQEDTRIVLDVTPPPPAPFDHRIVSAKHAQINSFYTVEKTQVVGRGRFGQVHRCIEKTSGLTLAAKIIKVKIHKEKEEVKNEIQVMNQLNHVNLIQLYDAFESRNDIVLVMEYVDGGELFDRIIDENSNLSEVDTILFIKQICEGIQYMHQMYIIHLDLKPENIMCVSRAANQIKIIDFGLARRYKPREKLKVHFGTPEFLAPEVVNYDFVSFPTDMWSVGVIAYMLLSGLSPFLGENDNETLNNILACQWDFEGEEFQHVSEDAKEFIIKLLVKDKGWRMCATEALKHSWLSDSELHHRISQQRKKESCPVPQAPVGQ